MVDQRRAPGVEHSGDADTGAEVLGIGRDRQHGLGRGLEQKIVDRRLILVGDGGDCGRQREDDVIVRHAQQLGLALGQPFPGGCALALGAVPIAAAVVGNGGVAAVLAALDVAAESRGAAALDGLHDFLLIEADMAGIGLPPCRSMAAEDIRDLERRTGQDRPVIRAACCPWASAERGGPAGSRPSG